MVHDVFGEITFQVGWKAKRSIKLFGKEYPVNLKIQAYFEEDGITPEQEAAYASFLEAEAERLQAAEKLLTAYSDLAQTRFVPKTFLVNRDGSYALLLDDPDDPDEGIAVCLAPVEEIVSQDDYL